MHLWLRFKTEISAYIQVMKLSPGEAVLFITWTFLDWASPDKESNLYFQGMTFGCISLSLNLIHCFKLYSYPYSNELQISNKFHILKTRMQNKVHSIWKDYN